MGSDRLFGIISTVYRFKTPWAVFAVLCLARNDAFKPSCRRA